MKGEKELYVISHTHWDREWYEVFQEYRMRLVRMIDRLLDLLETDPAYACFHLDGQTIVLEDYLDIRPQNRDRLTRLIQEGRLLIGPWYVMPDEFLVSGESLVRNLQSIRPAGSGGSSAGSARSDGTGGHLPDLPDDGWRRSHRCRRTASFHSEVAARGAP